MVLEIPRLSTYLRTHANVCHPDDKFLDFDENNDIIEKRRQAEIVKRRLYAKRKALEDGTLQVEQKQLFGANIPFNIEFSEPRLTGKSFSEVSTYLYINYLTHNLTKKILLNYTSPVLTLKFQSQNMLCS